MAGDRQVGERQRDEREQARIAVGRVAPGGRQQRQLAAEARRDGLVGRDIGAVEQQDRVRDPRDQPARGDRRLGADARSRRRSEWPIRPPDGAPSRAPPRRLAAPRLRSQPKPCSSRSQAGIGRLDVEGRAAAQKGDRAGKPELAVLDLAPEARVGGAQVLRHDQQLVGGRR